MSSGDGGEDASLDLPELPDLDGELGSLSFPSLPGDPPGRVVTGASARLAVEGDGLRMEAAGAVVMERLRVVGATAGDPTVTPLGVERGLASSVGTVTERAVVPSTGAAAFFEWTRERAERLQLEWRVPGGAEEGSLEASPGRLRWRRTERALVVARGHRRLLFVASEPGSFEVSPDAGALEVRFAVGATRHAMLGVAAAPEGEERSALRRMGRVRVAVRGRESRIRRLLEERFRLDASDPAPGHGLAWAIFELAAREAEPGDLVGWREAALAEASLASGEARTVRLLIREAFSRGIAAPPALAVLGRYLAWTGDRATVAAVWDAVLESVGRVRGPTGTGEGGRPGRGLDERRIRVATTGLARAAGDIGAEMPAPWSEASDPPRDSGEGDAVPVLLAGIWQSADPAAGAAARVLGLTAMLGVEPDAPRGRLTLRPRPPDEWTRFRVWNLRVGGSTSELEYERAGHVLRYTLRQTRGAPPLQVVFEPRVDRRRVRGARVDGAPADLEAVPGDGHWRVPVQLVLDRDRTVHLELATDDR